MKTVKILAYIGGITQVAGGALSIYGLYKSSFNPNYELFNSLIIAIPLILLSFIAGFSVLFIKSSKGALILIINYLLQFLQFKFKGFYYFYSLGPYLGFGFVKKVNQNISFWWEGSEFIGINIIRFVDDKIGYFLTFNIVAIFFLIILFLEYRNRKAKIFTTEN